MKTRFSGTFNAVSCQSLGRPYLAGMNDLPFVDEHRQAVTASPEAVWAAVARVLRRTTGESSTFAKVLGCEPLRATPVFEGNAGETVPGFRVVEATPGRMVLRGRHRFSDYALTFAFEGGELRAETRAAFPGVLGGLYRAAVIGTGGHRLITRRMLRQIAHAV